jgi:lipid-A-disaccharide synthase
MMKMGPILIIAGESSGEKYGAGIMQALQDRIPDVHFFGIGGKRMKESGADLLYSISDLSVVGIFEIILHIPKIKRILRRIQRESAVRHPQLAVLIDSPDFNLRLAKKLKKRSIPVFYYISPTVWAWRKNRLKTIKKYVAKMLLIFPFEESIYREQNIPAVFVGHPLLQRVQLTLSREEFMAVHGLGPDKKHIALLPGSRKSEISRHMPVLMKAVSRLGDLYDSEFILILAEDLSEQILSNYPEVRTGRIKIIQGDVYEAMAYSDLALSACGTATLEAALLETPVVAFYRMHPLTFYLGRPFVKIGTFSIVNILAGEKVIPELIQHRMTAACLVKESARILDSQNIRRTMIHAFRRIKQELGNRNSFARAAREITDYLNQKK